MDQNVEILQNKKAAKSRPFRHILFAGLCAIIMACLVFFVFPKRSLPGSFGYVRMQPEQITVPSPSISEAATPEPSYWPSVTLGTDTSSLWLVALNREYHGKFVEGYGRTSIEWPITPSQIKALEVAGLKDPSWREEKMFLASILSSAPFIEGGVTKEYVLTETSADQVGHSSSAILGGVVLAKKDGQWEVEYLQKYIAEGGSSGEFWPGATAITIGKNRPVFQVFDESDYQGHIGGGITLYAFVKGSFRGVLEGEVGDDRDSFHIERLSSKDKPDQPAFSTDTTLEPMPSSKDCYDIKMTRTDTKYLAYWNKTTYGGVWKVTGMTRTVGIYAFNGDAYVLKSGKDASAKSQK